METPHCQPKQYLMWSLISTPAQTDAQIGSGSHRADEGSAVAADDHCDGDVSRVDAELVANADQNGQQAVEVGVGIEQQSQRHAQDADDDGQETAQRGRDEACHDDCHLLLLRTPRKTPAHRMVEAMLRPAEAWLLMMELCSFLPR